MIACRRWNCPVCGTFGRRARRRSRRWANAAHIAWARALAAASRSRRADADGLMALSDCRMLVGGYDVRWPGGRPVPEWSSDLHALATRQRAELESWDTADVTAEVIGPLSYEDQSTMIGDPIADVLMRETEDDD